MTWIHIKNEVYQPCIRDCYIVKRSQMYFMQVYFTYDKFSFNKNSLVDIILHINIRTCWSVTETLQCDRNEYPHRNERLMWFSKLSWLWLWLRKVTVFICIWIVICRRGVADAVSIWFLCSVVVLGLIIVLPSQSYHIKDSFMNV